MPTQVVYSVVKDMMESQANEKARVNFRPIRNSSVKLFSLAVEDLWLLKILVTKTQIKNKPDNILMGSSDKIVVYTLKVVHAKIEKKVSDLSILTDIGFN